jgi:hypothetical protein
VRPSREDKRGKAKKPRKTTTEGEAGAKERGLEERRSLALRNPKDGETK